MDLLFNLEYVFLLTYASCMVLLLVYSLGQIHLMWISEKPENKVPQAGTISNDDLYYVTIQLPVYNEQHVVERLLTTVAEIDYPRDRFEIQLLDDSTDETTPIAANYIQKLRREGITVEHVRRAERSEYKAGALSHGLKTVRGDFVAIFDADFAPEPDFLRKTVVHFKDRDVAAVQVRWGHLNENTSQLTRIEAFMLSLHFGFEQPRRWASNLFMNFNGTCGVWRREAIIDAGGWNGRTLTEDIDLSYRAQLRGWRLVYLNDYLCPGELPEEMSGLRTQQYRWMKGGAENARLHLWNVIKAPLPKHVRWHAMHHLLAGSVYLIILAALLLSVPLAALKNTAISYDYVDFGIPFITSTITLFIVFHSAQSPRPNGSSVARNLRFVLMMALFLIFTMGMSVHNGLAVLSGWMGRKSAFIRTPKFGGKGWAHSKYARRNFNPLVLRDISMLIFLLVGIYIGWLRGQYAFFPIELMASLGLVWVITLSFIHPIKANRNIQSRFITPGIKATHFRELGADRR